MSSYYNNLQIIKKDHLLLSNWTILLESLLTGNAFTFKAILLVKVRVGSMITNKKGRTSTHLFKWCTVGERKWGYGGLKDVLLALLFQSIGGDSIPYLLLLSFNDVQFTHLTGCTWYPVTPYSWYPIHHQISIMMASASGMMSQI